MNQELKKLAVIGLGYVGLPLALAFCKKRITIGYDINIKRIKELKENFDRTNEVSVDELKSSENFYVTNSLEQLRDVSIFIVTVPTPIDKNNDPDMTALIKASEMLGSILKKGDIVIYESTVFPGTTEEICVPVLQKASGLKFNDDFFCGYSPERINPGDKKYKLTDIIKVTSGSNESVASEIDELYSSIITAGTFKVKSMKIAEAAKVIENVQRDVNIALINELSIIFDKLGLDTLDVLQAARTKWNFIDFKPGLVGGHCIGVDPYYLTKKAKEVGVDAKLILTSRSINNSMSKFIADYLIKELTLRGFKVKGSKVLILGLTFKENCTDLRNAKVKDIFTILENYGLDIDIHDPYASREDILLEYGQEGLSEIPKNAEYDGIIISVAHDSYSKIDISFLNHLSKNNAVFFDVMGKIESAREIKRL